MSAKAISPSVEFKNAFLAMLDDFDANDQSNVAFYAQARIDFSAYIASLLDEEAGRNLPDGYVPCTHRWLVDAHGEIVGVTRLRHSIETPFHAQNAGHIGYDVAPSKRGRGYGHLALAVALREAQRLNLDRVLLYTGKDNIPSRVIIERAGGILEGITYSEFWQEMLCKYWVPVCISK